MYCGRWLEYGGLLSWRADYYVTVSLPWPVFCGGILGAGGRRGAGCNAETGIGLAMACSKGVGLDGMKPCCIWTDSMPHDVLMKDGSGTATLPRFELETGPA
jgi:hypothetical protein